MSEQNSSMIMQQVERTNSWHALPLSAVNALLNSSANGLTFDEAGKRLKVHGFNTLPQQQAPPEWLIILLPFQSPLIYVLFAAALLSLFIGEVKDAAFIAGLVILNAIIGTGQET